MKQITSESKSIEIHVNSLLRLVDKEPFLKGKHNISKIKTSRDKVVDPRFEIIFAGTYSAGKSMLINALLGKDLLYSATGHATGLECYIEFAKSEEEERCDFTFLSEKEIQEEVNDRCQTQTLKIKKKYDINKDKEIEELSQRCQQIIEEEGGSKSTERAEEANGLQELLNGFRENRKYIHEHQNKTFAMEELDLAPQDAHKYARRGSNSAVLQRITYYCHHPLLEDGNVLVDLPGIDAPVLRDAELTDRKVADTNTSAVICVMKADQEGETETAEKKLIKAMRDNSGIRDRVFYVFNRIDKTWSSSILKQKLDELISNNFSHAPRGIYETSALLGYWASLIKKTNEGDRWGIDSIFQEELSKNSIKNENTHPFVLEFLDYCDSDKLPSDKFSDIVRAKKETKNQQYVKILNLYRTDIIDQLYQDSGIHDFRNAITRYLTEEKRPELFIALAQDINDLCEDIYQNYREEYCLQKKLPANVEEVTQYELENIKQEVWRIGEDFYTHIEEEIQKLVMDKCEEFKKDFENLREQMEMNLGCLIENFSVLDAFANTCRNHSQVTAPLVSVLGEAFYSIANGLEHILVQQSENLIASFFNRLISRVRKKSYYRQLRNLLLGDDCQIMSRLSDIEKEMTQGVKVLARGECTFFVIESPDLYDGEDSVWLYQFREALQEASKSRDIKRMVDAEPAIRQQLEIDFQSKFEQTIGSNFSAKIIKILSDELLQMAKDKRQLIWEQSELARTNKLRNIEKEAQKKVDERNQKLIKIEEKIINYNNAITGINSYLEGMKLDNYKLPIIPHNDSSYTAFFTISNSLNPDESFLEAPPSLDLNNLNKNVITMPSDVSINSVEVDHNTSELLVQPNLLIQSDNSSSQSTDSSQLEPESFSQSKTFASKRKNKGFRRRF